LSRFFLILALTLAAYPSLALAKPSKDALARAKVHFEAGTRHYDIGAYDEAAEEFSSAYALSQHPELLYNIYAALERGGRYVEAADALERYLELATVDPERRPTLEARLAALHARLAREPEEHEEEPPPADVVKAPDSVDEEEPESRRKLSAFTVASYATAGGMALTFGVFAGLARGERSSLESGCGATRSCTDDDVRTQRAFNAVADVSLVVGVAALTTAIVTTFLGRREEPRVEMSVFGDARSRGLLLGGRF
jgi:tetratricopeptide (TPR) repeat protein